MKHALEINLPMFISKLKEHRHVKDHLLTLIDHMPCSSIRSADSISKTDWNLEENISRPYLDFIKPKIVETITETFCSFGYPGIAFTKFWFQQYLNGDLHGWHVHSACHYTNVYFVELPDQHFKTDIQNWDRSSKITYSVEEGDILTFPSMLYHRSPTNYSKVRKTIISFNLDLLSSD